MTKDGCICVGYIRDAKVASCLPLFDTNTLQTWKEWGGGGGGCHPRWLTYYAIGLPYSLHGRLWLVGGLEHQFYFCHINWAFHHPNWRNHIFQRGGSTTNQMWNPMKSSSHRKKNQSELETNFHGELGQAEACRAIPCYTKIASSQYRMTAPLWYLGGWFSAVFFSPKPCFFAKKNL